MAEQIAVATSYSYDEQFQQVKRLVEVIERQAKIIHDLRVRERKQETPNGRTN